MIEDKGILLSGIQHFAFCPRQWALIHIEMQWVENLHTVEGGIFHERTHNEALTEKRGNIIIARGMRVSSQRLGIHGQCDVVEFHESENGINLHGREGLWQPYPIEYKKGRPKENNADELQLCCQAMCLEEMLACPIQEGSLYYGEPRRRTRVKMSGELRKCAEDILGEMRLYFSRGYTPNPKPAKRCTACSLRDICLPRLIKAPSIKDYLSKAMEDEAI